MNTRRQVIELNLYAGNIAGEDQIRWTSINYNFFFSSFFALFFFIIIPLEHVILFLCTQRYDAYRETHQERSRLIKSSFYFQFVFGFSFFAFSFFFLKFLFLEFLFFCLHLIFRNDKIHEFRLHDNPRCLNSSNGTFNSWIHIKCRIEKKN